MAGFLRPLHNSLSSAGVRQFHTQREVYRGTVQYFDSLRGTGVVKLDSGEEVAIPHHLLHTNPYLPSIRVGLGEGELVEVRISDQYGKTVATTLSGPRDTPLTLA